MVDQGLQTNMEISGSIDYDHGIFRLFTVETNDYSSMVTVPIWLFLKVSLLEMKNSLS